MDAEGAALGAGACGGPPGLKDANLFAYTCSFSVVALQAGARQVINVDMSDGALAIGKRNPPAQWPHRGRQLPAP